MRYTIDRDSIQRLLKRLTNRRPIMDINAVAATPSTAANTEYCTDSDKPNTDNDRRERTKSVWSTNAVKRGHSLDDLTNLSNSDQSLEDVPLLMTSSQAPSGKKSRKIITTFKSLSSSCPPSTSTSAPIPDARPSELCVFCAKSCSPGDNLHCPVCDQYYHLSCCGVDATLDTKYLVSIIAVLGWTCNACRNDNITELRALRKDLMSLRAKLNLENSNAANLSAVITPGTISSVIDDTANIAPPVTLWPSVKLTVRKTVNDSVRRRSNVVVSGLSASSDESDADMFSRLCEEYFDTKPRIIHPGTRRLGKEGANDKPRRLLVHLSSEAEARDIIRSARNLRSAEDAYVCENVFINSDLSPEEAKEAYRKRQQRRDSKNKKEEDSAGRVGAMQSDEHSVVTSGRRLDSGSIGSRTVWNRNQNGVGPREGSNTRKSSNLVVLTTGDPTYSSSSLMEQSIDEPQLGPSRPVMAAEPTSQLNPLAADFLASAHEPVDA